MGLQRVQSEHQQARKTMAAAPSTNTYIIEGSSSMKQMIVAPSKAINRYSMPASQQQAMSLTAKKNNFLSLKSAFKTKAGHFSNGTFSLAEIII